MNAIYKGKLYSLSESLTFAELIDQETNETLHIPYGHPDLIVDPTDDEINNMLPEG